MKRDEDTDLYKAIKWLLSTEGREIIMKAIKEFEHKESHATDGQQKKE